MIINIFLVSILHITACGKPQCITPLVFNRPSVFEVFLQSVTYSLSVAVLFYSLICKVFAPRLIQSIYCKVHGCVFHVCVPSNWTQNFMDWRLLVKECISKIAKLRKPYYFFLVLRFFLYKIKCLGEPANCALWGR